MTNKFINNITIGKENNKLTMVDVSYKKNTYRYARSKSIIQLPDVIWNKICNNEIISVKGPVISTSIMAGIMASKKTSSLIPFCHILMIDKCSISTKFNIDKTLLFDCEVKAYEKTGVEMEALMAVTIASLTFYDMCKYMSHNIMIKKIYLIKKTGGKSDFEQK